LIAVVVVVVVLWTRENKKVMNNNVVVNNNNKNSNRYFSTKLIFIGLSHASDTLVTDSSKNEFESGFKLRSENLIFLKFVKRTIVQKFETICDVIYEQALKLKRNGRPERTTNNR